MKATSLILTACGVLWCASSQAADDVKEARQISLGPVERFDPNARKESPYLSVFGDPALGLTGGHGGVVHRVGEKDQWYVGVTDHFGTPTDVAVMELDRGTGEMRTKEIIKSVDILSISPDMRYFFGVRRNRNAKRVWECFELSTDKALWTVEQNTYVVDATFSPDGREVIVLHGVGPYSESLPSAVSWYDAASGRRTRRVTLPGMLSPQISVKERNLLAATVDAVYVARPSAADGRCFVIPRGAAEATHLEIGEIDEAEHPQVRVGGVRRELLAFYNITQVWIFRLDATRLGDLGVVTTPSARYVDVIDYSSVRFAPDGLSIAVGRADKTYVSPITKTGVGELETFKGGSDSTDFTADGKYYLRFDEGGGRAFDGKTHALVNGAYRWEHPAHCCPITEAGFSTSGNLVVSSDNNKLLLWSIDGKLLAQLVSAREREDVRLMMQSAIIDERNQKVYAADGWDFLEWSLEEVRQRLSRKPLNVPRIKGTVIFNDMPKYREAELMSISFDASGQHLVTATRTDVRYRSVSAPRETTPLLVPKQDIFMLPRSIVFTDPPQRLLLQNSSRLYELDIEGKKEPMRLSLNADGWDLKSSKVFGVGGNGPGKFIYYIPQGADVPHSANDGNTMPVPADWQISKRIVGAKGTTMVVTRRSPGAENGVSLEVIDWPNKKVLGQEEFPWIPQSIVISTDEKRVVVGAPNRAIYVVDIDKMRQGGMEARGREGK